MSKGPGRIQRAIETILTKDPESAFTVEELCEQIYGTAVRKRHRVALLRAARGILKLNPELGIVGYHKYAFYHCRSLVSYARAKIKSEHWENGITEYQIDWLLAPGGYRHHQIVEGGQWWVNVQQWIAKHDGDEQLATKIEPYLEKRRQEFAAAMAMLRG